MTLTMPQSRDILFLTSGKRYFYFITQSKARLVQRLNRSLMSTERAFFYLGGIMRDKEKTRIYNRKWERKNREKRYCQRKQWEEDNKEKIKLDHKLLMRKLSKTQKYRKYYKEWWHKNTFKIKRYKDTILFGGNRALTIKRDRDTCRICGKTNTTLCVHHIDGKGKNSTIKNNNISNLITLCLSCHGKVHGGTEKCPKK